MDVANEEKVMILSMRNQNNFPISWRRYMTLSNMKTVASTSKKIRKEQLEWLFGSSSR
jgi:hypothetical protein